MAVTPVSTESQFQVYRATTENLPLLNTRKFSGDVYDWEEFERIENQKLLRQEKKLMAASDSYDSLKVAWYTSHHYHTTIILLTREKCWLLMHFLRDIFGSFGRELDLLWIICKLKLTSIQMMKIYPFLYSSCLIPLHIGLTLASTLHCIVLVIYWTLASNILILTSNGLPRASDTFYF